MRIALIGLPLAGKTTLCQALTGGHVETMSSRSGRYELKTAMVNVPDERINRLAALFNPRKVTYAQVRIDDIAGIARGSMSHEPLDRPALEAATHADALLQVIRAFEDERVPHPDASVDPARDLETLNLEMVMHDLIIVERRLERLQEGLARAKGDARQRLVQEQALLDRLAECLNQGHPIRTLDLSPEERLIIRGFQFLTAKPTLIVLNLGDDTPEEITFQWAQKQHDALIIGIRAALEREIAQLSPAEQALFLESYGIRELGLYRLVRECYCLLGLASFFTVGEDEVRAWTIPQGATAIEAAGVIHSDLARGFIRAEVIAYEELIACGSLAEARRQGKLRLEGKEYRVRDGDIISIRFNV